MPVPDCPCAILTEIVGSCSVLPGPLNVLLPAPCTHHHRCLATLLVLRKEKLVTTPSMTALAVRTLE